MISEIDAPTGVKLMRAWGNPDWEDPYAVYALYNDCAVFALVEQPGFLDIHVAMEKPRRRECRKAGREILALIGHHVLRGIIPVDKPHACNFARRMGFFDCGKQRLQRVDGRITDNFILWRKPEA